jgi:hypothetical protein
MSRTITKTIYQFDELSDQAKEKARDWWRGLLCYDEWWQSVYEDAEQVHIEITSFDLDHHEIAGRFTIEPHLVADEIQNNHGEECETYKTAGAYLQDRDKLVDEWPRDDDGEFENEGDLDDRLDELDAEFLQSILEDYRIMLRKELEYQESAENVDEAIRANEYEFYEDGSRI